jgi:hypothetical protein
MGKTKDPIWDHWREEGTGKVQCKYCLKSRQERHATRCKKHSASCIAAPMEVRRRFQDDVQQLKTKSSLISRELRDERKDLYQSELFDVDAVPSTAVAVCSSTSPLKNVSRLTVNKHKELEFLWAKAMIAGNVSFNWTQNLHLRKFFDKLGSGFVLPSRKEMSTSLLKKLDEESREKIETSIQKERHLSIVPDGWQNIRGLSVINVMLANPNSRIFYKSIETGNNQSSDYYFIHKLINKHLHPKFPSSWTFPNGRIHQRAIA